jgi:hypothetical protein
MMLSLQQLGAGRAGAAVFGGMLGLNLSPMVGIYTSMEEQIGLAKISLTLDIIARNIERKSLSPKQMKRAGACSAFPLMAHGITEAPVEPSIPTPVTYKS